MRVSIVWMLIGTLSVAACDVLPTLPQRDGASGRAVQTPATPTAQISPLPTALLTGCASPVPGATATALAMSEPSPTVSPSAGPTAIPNRVGRGPEGQEMSPLPGEAPVIEYEWSGGLVGMRRRVVVYADGRVVSLGSSRGAVPERVDATALESWLAEAKKAGFFEMKDSYLEGDACCDRITYRLTVRYQGQAKTVTTIDAAPGQPPQLPELLGHLNRLLAPPASP